MMEVKLDPQEIALDKYTLIAPLLSPDLEPAEKRRRRAEILATGNISERTLRRYIAQYRESGFDGLLPKTRSDKGSLQSIPEEIVEEAIELRKELPQRSVNRILHILEGEGMIKKGSVARSTLTRHLFNRGYGARELKAIKPEGKATRRFQKEHRNTLWQSDIKYGPYIPHPTKPGKSIRTYLIAFIDDATRQVCHGEFYSNQKLPILEDCLRKSILKCGIPKAIYVDNGKIFISKWMRIACARLGIRHIRTQPYAPEQKGKVERFNRTVEEFLNELKLQPVKNLEELNKAFRIWLEEGYNHQPHSSLNGQTPAGAFASDTKPVQFASPEECRDAFLWEEIRTVDKTGCISLKGIQYEAGIEFRRKKVDLRYDPFELSAIEIWYNGEKKKTVKPLIIGEYCEIVKKKSKDELSTSSQEATAQSAGKSRLLKVLEEENKKRNKNKLGAISFSSITGGEKNV